MKKDNTNENLVYKGSSYHPRIVEKLEELSQKLGVSFACLAREIITKWYIQNNRVLASKFNIVSTEYLKKRKVVKK